MCVTMMGMESEERLRRLRDGLEGSPYSLSAGGEASVRALQILKRCEEIDARYQRASAGFAHVATELQRELSETLVVREIHESNALELSPLSLKETKQEIDSAIASGNLAAHAAERAIESDDHLREVLGLHRARTFARQLVDDYREASMPIRETDVRSLHALVVGHEEFAGSYRSVDVKIAGQAHEPRSVVDLADDMRQLVRWVDEADESLNPALVAAVAHSWLAHIHPFEDGNGRMSRLMATLVLLRYGWPPLILRRADRAEYLTALATSDEGGDILPVLDLFVRSIRATLRHLEQPDLARRLLNEELSGNAAKRYTIWLNSLNEFIDQLRASLVEFKMFVTVLEMPPVRSLVQLEERDSSANFWLLKAHDAEFDRDVLVWVGFSTDQMNEHLSSHAPSLFFGVRDYRADAEHTYWSDWRGSILGVDEIALMLRITDRPAYVRRQQLVDDVTIADAARSLASAIAASSVIR